MGKRWRCCAHLIGQVGIAVTVLTPIQEVLGSNLCQDTSYPHRFFMVFLTTSQYLSSSYHPTIWRHVNKMLAVLWNNLQNKCLDPHILTLALDGDMWSAHMQGMPQCFTHRERALVTQCTGYGLQDNCQFIKMYICLHIKYIWAKKSSLGVKD
jgi:hypothetical protein